MQVQITDLANQLNRLETTQQLNHNQNRKDIHDLRGGQQRYVDALQTGFDRLADSITKRIEPLEAAVMDLRLKWARAIGSAMGISALGAIVFELVKVWLERTVAK